MFFWFRKRILQMELVDMVLCAVMNLARSRLFVLKHRLESCTSLTYKSNDQLPLIVTIYVFALVGDVLN